MKGIVEKFVLPGLGVLGDSVVVIIVGNPCGLPVVQT